MELESRRPGRHRIAISGNVRATVTRDQLNSQHLGLLAMMSRHAIQFNKIGQVGVIPGSVRGLIDPAPVRTDHYRKEGAIVLLLPPCSGCVSTSNASGDQAASDQRLSDALSASACVFAGHTAIGESRNDRFGR